MDTTTIKPDDTRTAARESFTGKRLTDSQFDTAWNITGIIRREIEKSGSFIEPLTDYARTFAGRNTVDASKEEIFLRDIYAARFGETLNQTREALLEREANVRDDSQDLALNHARSALAMIQEGSTMPFWQAQDRAGVTFAQEQGISERFAKSFIKDAFETVEGQDFYRVGKELEAKHHHPVRDAERAARQADRAPQTRGTPSRRQ